MKTNKKEKAEKIFTGGGGVATKIDDYKTLRRTVLTCMLWEDVAYENGETTAERISSLVAKLPAIKVSEIAIEAREVMHLRHVPLFVISELSKRKDARLIVGATLERVIKRPDELCEYIAIRWKDKKTPLSAQEKKGLGRAFAKFNEYSLAKFNKDGKIRLKDVLRICHPKPKDNETSKLWKRVIEGNLKTPDTWEVQLSAGKDKKETFERLIKENKLGGMAMLMNLRNMVEAGVNTDLIEKRLEEGADKALPFRFITAAKHAPSLNSAIEKSMFKTLEKYEKLPGRTLFVIDVSGSMRASLSRKSDSDRLTAASALAMLIREVCEKSTIYCTAGNDGRRIHRTELIPDRRGFALSDLIENKAQTMGGGGIFMVQCMNFIAEHENETKFDRVIVFTDEQDCDSDENKAQNSKKLGIKNYIVNISCEKHGVGYRKGWSHIDGWSEGIIDFIVEAEKDDEEFDDLYQ